MRRTGIDLSSTRCVVVDADAPGRRRKHDPSSIRIHRVEILSGGGNREVLATELSALVEAKALPRRAWVNLWDVPSSHQYLLLPSGSPSELESTARRHAASVLGIDEADATVATSIGATREERWGHPKTEVSFFAARSHDVQRQLRPVIDAGFVVEGVTTPCGALWSQARLRRTPLPGVVHAHVVLGLSQSALGIFSNGLLLYARDLDWGFSAVRFGQPAARDREELATRLSAELRRSFLYLKQYCEQDVSQVVLCGDMPEIRSLTAPLIERLNIEVETLDTLEGIDPTSLPEGFVDRAATFRLASAIAVEPPPVNLIPTEVASVPRSPVGKRAFAAGTAAAVAVAALLYTQASVARSRVEREITELLRQTSERLTTVRLANTSPDRRQIDAQQRALLRDLDAQGPIMARVLEQVANAAPGEITVTSIRAVPDRDHWSVTIEAFALGADLPRARSAADTFLRALAESPVFGEPVQLPTRRVSGVGRVELAASYRVSK